jgi:hypothetical protein
MYKNELNWYICEYICEKCIKCVYVKIYMCMKVNVQKPGIYIPFAVTCNASRTLQNA